jgi:hypothetical protein
MTPCRFATLTRKDYYESLSFLKKKEMRGVIEFFKNFRIFAGLRNNTIEKIALNMESKSYTHG